MDDKREVEAAQFLQSLHDIAEGIAERMRGMPEAQAGDYLERELAGLAVSTRRFEGISDLPEIVSSIGFHINAVIRTRAAKLLEARGVAPQPWTDPLRRTPGFLTRPARLFLSRRCAEVRNE